LFQGNGVGATASANWLSLIATAKANALEPYAYLLHSKHASNPIYR